MSGRKRLVLLVSIFTIVAASVAGITLYSLYQTAFEEERARRRCACPGSSARRPADRISSSADRPTYLRRPRVARDRASPSDRRLPGPRPPPPPSEPDRPPRTKRTSRRRPRSMRHERAAGRPPRPPPARALSSVPAAGWVWIDRRRPPSSRPGDGVGFARCPRRARGDVRTRAERRAPPRAFSSGRRSRVEGGSSRVPEWYLRSSPNAT